MVVEFTITCAIVAYHHLSCEFEPHSWRGVLDKTLCDQVCQWLATGLWISLGTLNFRHKSSNWNIFESGDKHLTSNGQMMDQTFVYVVHNIKHLWVIMWELSVGLCPKNIYSFWIKLFFFILEVQSRAKSIRGKWRTSWNDTFPLLFKSIFQCRFQSIF